MNIIFIAVDKKGKKIRLTDKQWTHITIDHPFMTNFLEDIKEIIENPDKITQSLLDDKISYFYKFYKHKKGSNKYLLTIIKYLNGDGFVISSYFVNKIK